MEKELVISIENQLAEYFNQIADLLQDPINYADTNDINSVDLYLSWVKAAFKKPYLRISHIHFFLSNELLFIEEMSPFCYLKKAANEKILILYLQMEWMILGLQGFNEVAAKTITLANFKATVGEV